MLCRHPSLPPSILLGPRPHLWAGSHGPLFVGKDTVGHLLPWENLGHSLNGALSAPVGGQALVSGSRSGKALSTPASGECWVPRDIAAWGGQPERVVTLTGACHCSARHCLALSVGQVTQGRHSWHRPPCTGGETEELRDQVWRAAGRA